jgi:hypothetical protein
MGWLLAAVILAGAAAFGAYLTGQDPALLSSLAGWSPIRSETAPLGPPQAGKEDPRDVEGLPEPERWSITLEQINELLRRQDVRAALIDAQIWQHWLADSGVEEKDPRRMRLVEVIAELIRRLTPQPQPPPAYVGEFRKLLGELRTALAAEDLAAARAGFKKADALFRKHPAELASLSQTLVVLKGKLRQLEALQEGIARIAQLLEDAAEHAKLGKPTDALESESWAKFLALETPLSEPEAVRLDQMVRDLTPALRYARGKRAVDLLDRLRNGGDDKTRDFLVHEAATYLPGLPDAKVGALIQRAEALRRQRAPKPDAEFSSEVAYRRHYEAILQSFAAGETAKTLDACVAAVNQFAPQLDKDGRRDKVGEIAFEIVEPDIIRWTSVPETTPGLVDKLKEARSLLGRLTPWREHARYRLLDGALERQQDKLAHGALERAAELAKANKLEDAITAARAAAEWAGPQAKDTARKQVDAWQAEIRRQSDLVMQEKRLAEIRKTLAEDKVPQAWRLWDEFRRDYPTTPHGTEIAELRAKMEPVLAAQLDALFAELERHWQAEDWRAFRETGEILLVAPSPDRYAAGLKRIRDALADFERQADGRYHELRRQHGTMTNAKHVAALVAGLAEVLTLQPKHAEARELLDQAAKLHEEYCSRLYRVADQLVRQQRPEPARRRLEEVIDLDPQGSWGTKARKLLASMKE